MSAALAARGNIEPRGPSLSIGTVGLFVNRIAGRRGRRRQLDGTRGRPAERPSARGEATPSVELSPNGALAARKAAEIEGFRRARGGSRAPP
jgi:hypothetical protein